MDISKLSKEEKAELLRKLKEEEKTESIRRKETYEALRLSLIHICGGVRPIGAVGGGSARAGRGRNRARRGGPLPGRPWQLSGVFNRT